jgi:hypothetical protein
MTRRVFFSFHYDRDIWRACIVRNCWLTQEREAVGFWDASLWEAAKKTGDEAIRRMIDNGLKNTSVTAVLIGTETWSRKWVRYEIEQSYIKGNGLLGISIHNIKDQNGSTDLMGSNPFNTFYIEQNGRQVYFSELYPTYDYIFNGGYSNIGSWIEKAAADAGR